MAADDSTAGKLSAEVLQAYARTPDPRLGELLSALIKHLHAFATETGLTPQEWMAGVEFLTAVGQKCDPRRQEFIPLSDVLGLSSLVQTINAADGATEPTVLGPFYLPGAPHRLAPTPASCLPDRFELDPGAAEAWEALSALPARDLPGLRRLIDRPPPFSAY